MTKNMWILLAKIVAFVLMTAAIIVLSVCLKRQGDEKRRIKENYDTEMRKDFARQQTVDVAELKEYFSNEVEKLKQHGIRPKDVENIINVSYIYRDTTIYRDTLVYVYDTVKNANRADFSVQADCYDIGGQIIGDTLEISRFSLQDDLLISLYKEKRKCLFAKRRVKAIAISGCTGDTLTIKRNLLIQK